MTLHSEIWRRSVTGQSIEQIATELAPAIDRSISGVTDKTGFVSMCLRNIEQRPDFAAEIYRGPGRYIPSYPVWIPATEARHKEMEERYRDGESPETIARAFGLRSPDTIVHHLKRRGVWRQKETPKVSTLCPVKEIATLQSQWEHRQALLRARRKGETLRSLGKSANRSPERVRQLIFKAERQEGKPSPLEKWMADVSYLRDLAELVKQASSAPRTDQE